MAIKRPAAIPLDALPDPLTEDERRAIAGDLVAEAERWLRERRG